MAVSGTVSSTAFDTRRVIDNAFRRCRLPAQSITPEMQDYAQDALYLLLSEMASVKPPSWCVERQIYPFYEGQYAVPLAAGTVEVLNANLRTLQELDPGADKTVITPTSYTVDFSESDGNSGTVTSVGIKWSPGVLNPEIYFQVSNDELVWSTVATEEADTSLSAPSAIASAGHWTWTDITPALAYTYFRIISASVLNMSEVFLGTLPQEIPMGVLNRDTYVAQSNKVMTSRPLTYWFQRDRINPVMNVWPAPNAAAEHQQLIVWRHRHIMDVGTLRQDIEVPQRWIEAIVAGLAAKMALETPAVDIQLIALLDQKASGAMAQALAGDNSGAPSFIQPSIGAYTR